MPVRHGDHSVPGEKFRALRNRRAERYFLARITDSLQPQDNLEKGVRMKPASGRLMLAAVATAALTLALMSGTAIGAPVHSAEEINESISRGVAYLDAHQNGNGSYGTSYPYTETGMALLSYAVLANGKPESLPTSYQEHVKSAIEFLLKEQNSEGYWADGGGFLQTYTTSLDIAGLEAFKGLNSGIPAAIAKGREFLIEKDFQGSARTGCSTEVPGNGTAGWCGGWNYWTIQGRSDGSNTGLALFGLHQTGGVPVKVAEENIGWQRHVQEISSNPFHNRNDGGGNYEPGRTGEFSSNASETGSMLFGFAYDGLTESDAGVKAGIKLGEDALNVYELEKGVNREAIYHVGASEDGSCTIGSAGCDWVFMGGFGGYHYSMFSLTKGLGAFVAANSEEEGNWYAKVVDLLLTQQQIDGSWPQNGEADPTTFVATAFSVMSLGLVGVSQPTETTTALSGAGQYGESITVPGGTAVTDHVTLSGKNTSKATGTVEYKVYSDNECKSLVASAGTVEVAGGVVPASSAETLAPGTYYWTASYGGDRANKPSSSKCGAETVKVSRATCLTDTGLITLVPGLTRVAAIQTMKIEGTLGGCTGEQFKGAKYTAILKTAVPVSCSALPAAGNYATGTALYKWTPEARVSTGTLSMPLTETAAGALSGKLETGPFSPSPFLGTVTEIYSNAANCGVPEGRKGVVKPVTLGTFSGSAVLFF